MSQAAEESNDRLHRLLEECDERLNQGRSEEAIALYETAWQFLPEPRTEQPYAVHILAAIGDARFQRGEFVAGRDALMTALRCDYGEPIGNPFLLLRLGQCMLELGEAEEAAIWLAGAYLLEGTKLFAEDDPKYLAFIANNNARHSSQ